MSDYSSRSIGKFSSNCILTEKWGVGLSLGVDNDRLISEQRSE